MASHMLLICLSVAVLTILSAIPADQQPVDLTIRVVSTRTIPAEQKHVSDCPENERYYKCQLDQCIKICDYLKKMPPCPLINADCYDPACLCDFGYVKNSEEKCVPEDKCS